MAGNAVQLETDEQEYLAVLGKRVREARARQGLSRRALAVKSGVSERYLAQLEGGQGNISVLLLRRVAQAVALGLPDLLWCGREQPIELTLLTQYLERLSPHKLAQARSILASAFGEHGDKKSRDRVALIGLRGAGKSVLGHEFAAAIGVPFIELDREVEREAGATLADIFSLYGQKSYHRLERRCLEQVLEQNEKVVIATGGGIVTEPETYDLLRDACFVVWIKASPEEHMRRVVEQGDMRPISGRTEAMEELRRILEERRSLYGMADVVVETSGSDIDACLRTLLEAYRGSGTGVERATDPGFSGAL